MGPEEYEEKSFVTMLGSLHIKLALLRALGDLLDGSGWTSALVQAEIATAGTSNSFLKAMRVKKNCSCSPDYSLRSVQASAGIIC